MTTGFYELRDDRGGYTIIPACSTEEALLAARAWVAAGDYGHDFQVSVSARAVPTDWAFMSDDARLLWAQRHNPDSASGYVDLRDSLEAEPAA